MEFFKSMDISAFDYVDTAFDWDDTALIEEYDRIMKTTFSTKKASSKSKENKGATSKEKHSNENEGKPWAVRDYCRAVYHEDGLVYEATIVDIYGDTCTVEFLGYGDLEEVALNSLLESNGKKARQNQRKRAKAETGNYASENDVSDVPERREANKVTKPAPQHQNTAYQWDYYAGQSTQPYQPPHPAPVFTHTCVPPLPTAFVQRIGDSAQYPPPPAPPMPHCSAVTRDPALSAMLVSWYMAGYYTGLHQNQKSTHCSAAPKPRCCDHHHAVPNCCDHSF